MKPTEKDDNEADQHQNSPNSIIEAAALYPPILSDFSNITPNDISEVMGTPIDTNSLMMLPHCQQTHLRLPKLVQGTTLNLSSFN